MLKIRDYLENRKIPPGWTIVEEIDEAIMWRKEKAKMTVMASVAREQDDRVWIHLSMSHDNRMPTYEELYYLKRHWGGDDYKCIMVLPSRDEHVSLHQYCMHLFRCVDEDPLPDFTWGMGMI